MSEKPSDAKGLPPDDHDGLSDLVCKMEPVVLNSENMVARTRDGRILMGQDADSDSDSDSDDDDDDSDSDSDSVSD